MLAPFHPEAEARREVAALREFLGLSQEDRILDLGCGWGRHLLLLREAGHDVTGVDLSPALLRQAREDAGHGPDSSPSGDPAYSGNPASAYAPGLALVAADMRRLPLADHAFDVVLNLATSLGLFLHDEDAMDALAETRRVLRPGGRLLVEGMHRDDVVSAYAPRDQWRLADGTVITARRRFDALRGVSHEVLRWRENGRVRSMRHSLRLRTATEIARLLESAGLEVQAVYGGWRGEAFQHTSERLVLLASD